MNFLSMKYFIALAEEKSFTRAAEKLHITQQTLSAHMANLEREVGIKLLIRHIPLELTDGGQVFYRYARIFQRNELSLLRELSDVSGSECGVLRIGVAPSRGQVLLPPMIQAFHKKYPHVTLVLSEMANGAIWNALKRDEIDLAMAHSLGVIPGIVQTLCETEEIVLLISKNIWQRQMEKAGISYDESFVLMRLDSLPSFLSDCPFLINSEDDIAGALARKLFRQSDFEPHILVQSEHMGTMLRLCSLGLGAYFCPKNLAEVMLTAEEKEKVCMISLEEGMYDISFGYQKSSHRWSMISNFITCSRV